jgi:hypothetical protein
MPAPTSISVEILNPVSTVVVSPVEEIDQISVNTVPEVDSVTVDNTDSITTISFDETTPDYVVDVGIVNFTAPVTSVNGKTGAVSINYSDIAGAPDWSAANGSSNAAPVNQVRFVYTQNAPANQWTINHNLGFFPNITILDNQNRLLEVHVEYLNINTARIVMNSACSGTAYLT